jgi:hypothetical protein
MFCASEGQKRNSINQIDNLYLCIDKSYNGRRAKEAELSKQ